MKLNKTEQLITEDALNYYWLHVIHTLNNAEIGRVQRSNLELDKKRLSSLIKKFR